ncbi:YfhO family protein [Marinicella meishanensis]|uniref:YfhO family protein n=1 Tax=Marinicella meishanensis TaxID=2873263 RepID=UPI001CBEAA24|nr:YfhO family protein [Marinicella sp. NBU2979]
MTEPAKHRLTATQQWLLVMLLYAVLVTLFCYPLLQGKIITQTDFLHFVSPWDAVKPAHLAAPGNPFLQDQSTEFWPFFMEAKRQFAAGTFPLWNPYIFAGNPLWANTQSALLYPLNGFHYLFDGPWGFTISSWLKLFMGGMFMHLFLRRLGLSHGACLLGGVAFGFCTFTVFWLNHPHTNVTPLIPLSFYLVERLLSQPDRQRMAWYALLVALTLLAGHVEIAFLTALGCGLYYVLRLWQLGQISWLALWRFLAVHLWALLLAAILIVPFIEFLFHTAIWTERGDAVQFSIPTAGLFNLIHGDFFRAAGWDPGGIGFHAFSAYVGLVAVPLLLFAVLHSIKTTWPWLLLGGLSLAIAFTVQPFNGLIKSLPLFNHLPLFYFNILAVFATCVLAAVGLHHVLTQQDPKHRRLLMWIAVLLALIWLAVWWLWTPGDLARYAQDTSAMLAAAKTYLPWVALVWLLVCLWLWLTPWLPRWLLAGVLVAVLYADVWRLGSDWNPAIEPALAMPVATPGSLAFLQQQTEPFRTVGYHGILRPSTNMLAQLRDVRGYDVPVIDRYHHFFNRALRGQDAFWVYNLPHYDAEILPYLNLMNARYLLAKRPLSPLVDGLELVYEGEILIYENQQAMGHARLFQQAEYVGSAAAALDRVIELAAALREVVVIEAEAQEHGLPALVEAAEPAAIEHLTTTANRLAMQVQTSQAGWLVLSQSHYPGWVATINGEETEIFAANSLLQAIKIPPGDHRIEFSYHPLSFTLGWLLSLLTLLATVWTIRHKK